MLVVRFQKILFFSIFLLIPFFANANVVINEIMYDLKDGSDTGREWIEIFNNGTEQIDLSGWKLCEAEVNHKIATTTANNFIIPAGGFAIIADNQEKFLADWPNFSGIIFDSTFSLSNTGETLILRNVDLADIDTVAYASDMGANGDGKSLQKVNNQWIANDPTPGAQNTSGQSSSQNQSTSTSTSEVDASQTTTVVVWPTEPQIYANAGSDKTAVAGADVYFSGQALGLQKEPLENARYLWNFGDGAIAEGQNTKHVYKYPGEYIVVLDVSSGKYSVSDRLMAKIIPNQLEIIEANQNYIKLHNGSNVELDISSWFLRTENSLFKFPANTFIKTNRDLMIDSSISGLKAENQKAEILYPNSSVANSYFGYAKAEKEKEPKSTTVVDSKKIEEIEELSTSTAQVANIISTTEPNSFGLKKWLMIILGMSVFFAGGFIFIRRQSSL